MAEQDLTELPDFKSGLFEDFWNKLIPEVSLRENFNRSHREQLIILCDILVEIEELSAIIKTDGYTYISVGRNGEQIKMHPAVAVVSRHRSEVRNYSKMLGLILVKDSGAPDEGGEWE